MRIAWFFIWTNINSLYPRLLCAKFGWNWPSGSGGGDFLILSLYFSPFHNYLPLEKNAALHLNKLESPLPKDALCQVWLKFGPVVLEKKMKMWKYENHMPVLSLVWVLEIQNSDKPFSHTHSQPHACQCR